LEKRIIKLLLVDGHNLFREVLKEAIESTFEELGGSSELQVVQKSNGLEAKKAILEGLCPDVVMADNQMPELSGMGLIEFIVSRGDIKHIFLLTLYDSEELSLEVGIRGAKVISKFSISGREELKKFVEFLASL